MNNIRELRIQKNLSQIAFAKQLGIKNNTLSQYETGAREPSVFLLAEMSNILGCTIEDLIKKDK